MAQLPQLLISGPYSVSPLQIPTIEETKGCYYIGSTSIPVKKDRPRRDVDDEYKPWLYVESPGQEGNVEWSYTPLDIFWQPIVHAHSDEHLFGLYRREGTLYIRSTNHFDGIVGGIYIPSTNVLTYSTYRHDFFCPNDPTPEAVRVCVDGGRDYLRILGEPGAYEIVTINLIGRTFHGDNVPLTEFTVPCSSNPPCSRRDYRGLTNAVD